MTRERQLDDVCTTTKGAAMRWHGWIIPRIAGYWSVARHEPEGERIRAICPSLATMLDALDDDTRP